MATRSFSRLLPMFALALTPPSAATQEIPLKHCDTLPVIDVGVGG